MRYDEIDVVDADSIARRDHARGCRELSYCVEDDAPTVERTEVTTLGDLFRVEPSRPVAGPGRPYHEIAGKSAIGFDQYVVDAKPEVAGLERFSADEHGARAVAEEHAHLRASR